MRVKTLGSEQMLSTGSTSISKTEVAFIVSSGVVNVAVIMTLASLALTSQLFLPQNVSVQNAKIQKVTL
jgi:hypothetical protein